MKFCKPSPINILHDEAKVKELIRADSRGWDVELVKPVFNEYEASVICKLPVSLCGLPDKQIWAFSKNDQMEVMAVVLRRVWLRRNGLVFENKFEGPNEVFNKAIDCLLEYQLAQVQQGKDQKNGGTCSSNISHRKPPTGNMVKVNWDTALKTNENRAEIRIVICDNCREVLVTLCYPKEFVSDPIIVEVFALWRAMKLCDELNFWNAQLEGDALTIVNAVNSLEVNWEWHGQLIEDLKALLKNRRNWTMSYVNRSCNSVAHSLAKMALSVSEELVWMEDHPQEILKNVIFDKLCNSIDTTIQHTGFFFLKGT
ncbi:uncharacterized protein LOC122301780 [Carya illinoinensis]|uniref:uncharacterized protein LOC122301780 n=1 Tax=Carya illinoinensis TaxID=32201 RepID=UPI001C7202FB|nr:uncharacterized protein LOC122301780 [Carya illinoinensis]